MKHILYLLLFTIITVNVSAQSTEVKHLLDNLLVKNSDTTEVIYVLLKEDYFEELHGDSVKLVSYPFLETIYGYHVQNWKPYSVVFYDSKWNIIEEPLFIKKRTLKK